MRRTAKQTFAAGDFGEGLVRRLLSEAYISSWKNIATNREGMTEWDIQAELESDLFTVEVKFDQMEAKTGNIAVEYWNTRQNKPSGILATASDLWVFVLQEPVTVWICLTQELRVYFLEQPCLRDVLCGGDGNAAMKLFRKDELFDAVFYRIDHMEPWELNQILRELLEESNASQAV